MTKIMEIIEVKKLYNGCVSLRDYKVEELIKNRQDVIISFENKIMILSFLKLSNPLSRGTWLFTTQFEGAPSYYLWDYAWNPGIYSELDIKRIDLLGFEWWKKLKEEFGKEYMIKMAGWLSGRRKQVNVYPSPQDVFKAFKLCQPHEVKIIIIGQDPYHTKEVASGLAFGIKINEEKPIKIPPSLRVIFDELERDIKFGLYLDFDYTLEYWAKQGVLLLNVILTVEEGLPLSHKNIGWERFTANVFSSLKAKKVYILWGREAKEYEKKIQPDNLILTASHPAAEIYAEKQGNYNGVGFKNCNHFSKANKYLEENNIKPVTW